MTHQKRLRRHVFLAFALFMACVCFSRHSLGQATVRELRETALRHISEGEFERAIPDLEMLISVLGDSRLSQVRSGLEIIYYYRGLCYFFSGQFEQAEKAFREYVEKYRHGARTHEGYLYIADALRFSGKLDEAIQAYRDCLRRYTYPPDLLTDIHASIARCYLADDNWDAARDPLLRALFSTYDPLRRAWAATLLATAHLKTLDVEKVFPMVPHLLRRDSLASRSIAFNLAAVEAGDELFATERYREALWVHRLVYPHDEVLMRSEAYLDWLEQQAEYERRYMTQPRRLMRLQESIAELEAEIEAIQQIENYDLELFYRIGRGYMEHRRYREARDLFLHLHSVGGGEEALYLAFQCAAQVQPWERAYAIGDDYMRRYPGGEWYDILTLTIGQMHAREQNWVEVIRHLSAVLEARPDHQAAAECLFLIGYASFMEERFDEALARFMDLRRRFPQSELMSGAVYWSAMSHLFDTAYEEAARDFDTILMRFSDSEYVEDSAFRRAVCNYGLAQYEMANERLDAFLQAYPKSRLAYEALMMRGDIAGALGELDAAVAFYERAMQAPEDLLNIELYNHSAFQAGQILYDDQRYDDMRALFERYINRDRQESNIPLAVYWIGKALWQKGEREGAMRYYRETMSEYGKERDRIGVDLILDEWVANARQSPPDEAARAWADLQQALREAINAGEQALAMRLQRMLLFHPSLRPSERDRLTSSLLQRERIPYASPAVLQVMLDAAIEREQHDLADRIAEEIVGEFPETDYALDARMTLAKRAILQARTADVGVDTRALRAEAERHLNLIRTVFAVSEDAGRALLLLGELYRDQRRIADADNAYRDVLGVREWSHLWPEALYGRGLCAEAQRDHLKAAAYFERIYLMYAHYREWAAKAYLARADNLRRAYEEQKAIETLRAFVEQPEFSEFPEFQEAMRRLEQAGGGRTS